jgi:hypothetical protein
MLLVRAFVRLAAGLPLPDLRRRRRSQSAAVRRRLPGSLPLGSP